MRQDWTNEELLTNYSHAQNDLEVVRRTVGLYEQEIIRRMREEEATSIPSDRFTCELETRNTLDSSRLIPLKELLLPADLEAAWTPEHEETKTVPEKWNGTKLNSLARSYGGNVRRIIEEAKVPGAPKIKFARKEQ